MVAAYQPETVYRIFERAIYGQDVATGDIDLEINANYSSTGPADSLGTRNKIPETSEPSICYLYSLGYTCTPDEIAGLENGTAVVKDSVVTLPRAATNGSGSGGGSRNSTSGGGGQTSRNAARKVGSSVAGAGLPLFVLGPALLNL